MAEHDQDQQSKTEDATPYKLEEMRKKGHVAQTKELGSAVTLLAVALLFYFYGQTFLKQLLTAARSIFMKIEHFQITEANISALLLELIKGTASIIAPILIICLIIGFFISAIQTGFIITTETLKINFEKINPIAGFKRLFSLRSVFETIKTLAKLSIIASVVYIVVKDEVENSVLLMDQGVPDIIRFLGLALFKTVIYVGCLMFVVAIVDFIYQKLRHAKEMRMTKQEIKEELKDREGDPNVRARRRSLQRQIATKRMIQEVPKAQAIVTNPTHIAIAIQYNKDMAAPKVVAKGADYIAEKMRSIAKEHDIPLVENKPLAWTLYKSVKVGAYIPENLYNAVAEVLAYVVRVKNKFSDMFMEDEASMKPGETTT